MSEEQQDLFPQEAKLTVEHVESAVDPTLFKPLKTKRPYVRKQPLKKVTRKKPGPKKSRKYHKNPEATKKATERLLANRLTKVTLSRVYRINGICYGPGVMHVPASVAAVLVEGEQNSARAEEKFHSTRGVIIGRRNTKIEVPIEAFNDSMDRIQPFDTVSGKGMIDRG